MSFKLSDFIAAPSQELLDKAKKSDLLDIADHYGLSNIKTSMLKHEIKNILIQFFVDEEIFDSSATSQILIHVIPPGSSGRIQEMRTISRPPGKPLESPRC